MTRHWLLACAGAETLGMTVVALSPRVADAADTSAAVAAALLVLAGLVEGAALGLLQAGALAPVLGVRARRRWVVATVLVAGLGWAAGLVPGVLAGPGGSTAEPPLGVLLLGAVGLGLLMGAGLGAAQAWATGCFRRTRSWVAAGALGWAGAMPVVFLGATTVGPDWGWTATALTGAFTGAAAGLVLGALTAPFLVVLRPEASVSGARIIPRRPGRPQRGRDGYGAGSR